MMLPNPGGIVVEGDIRIFPTTAGDHAKSVLLSRAREQDGLLKTHHLFEISL